MMSLSSHTFWIDYESGKLLESFTSGAQAKTPVFVQGDTSKVEIHLLRKNGSIREEIGIPAGATLKMGIGRLETAPTGGSFKLGYKGTPSASIAYNATASAIQSALNGIPDVASEGGISVAAAGDAFLLSWNSGTTHDPITSDPDELFPTSQIVLVGQVVGDVQKVLLHLQQSPVAFLQTFSSMGEPELTSELIATIGSKKVYRISISPNPAGGSFYISGTNPSGTIESGAISVNATSADVLNALPATIITDASVSKSGLFSWDVSISSANSLTADGSGIIGWVGVEGMLSLNTVQIHEFLNARENAPALLEFVLSESTGETTILQTPCSIVADLIDEGSIAPLDLTPPLSEAVANNRFIRKDIASAPSEETQDIIWQNLGVTIDGSSVVDAIDGASSPTGGNPFATMDDLDGLASESYVTSQGYVTSSTLSGYALLTGATFSGKVNFTTFDGDAGLNIGIGGTSAASVNPGDLYINTGSPSLLRYRDANSVLQSVPILGGTNTFTAPQIINAQSSSLPALRVTQKGSGEALRIEDEDNPDATPALVIDGSGRVGFGTAPDPTYCINIDGQIASGMKISNGSIVLSNSIIQFSSGTLNDINYSSSNPFTSGSFSSNDYPYEVLININGTTYAVPARSF